MRERETCMTLRIAEETLPATISDHLIPEPSLAGHSIQRDERQHAFLIDQHLIACTPTEYRLLALLLEQADRCVLFAQLIAQFQEEPCMDAALLQRARNKLMHVISDLRAKVWASGLDIASVMGVGYILLSSQPEEMALPADER
jgi:DNA-binding response OmpR family regulator